MKNDIRALMIVTSHAELGSTGQKTGFWLEELAAPYLELVLRGVEVDIASPKGGRPPADPKSASSETEAVRAFLADRIASKKLDSTIPLAEASADYDAYFVVGGHGVMWDLARDPALAAMLAGAHDRGRIVAAVCHGPAALVGARLADGRPLVAGRRVAAFSNEEEALIELTSVVPFALESELVRLGARYERGANWASHVAVDDRLITGQNPASSVDVARAVLRALEIARPRPLTDEDAAMLEAG